MNLFRINFSLNELKEDRMKRERGNTWLRTKAMFPKADGEKGIVPCSLPGRGGNKASFLPAGSPAEEFFLNHPAEGVKAWMGYESCRTCLPRQWGVNFSTKMILQRWPYWTLIF